VSHPNRRLTPTAIFVPPSGLTGMPLNLMLS